MDDDRRLTRATDGPADASVVWRKSARFSAVSTSAAATDANADNSKDTPKAKKTKKRHN